MKTRIAILIVSLLAVVLSGCGRRQPSQSATPPPAKVRFGVSPFQDTLLPILGADEHKGWYREEGLAVEFRILGWEEVQEALAAGAIDVAINNCSSIVATHHRRNELIYWYGFNTFDNGFALMVRPNSGFHSVEDLAKKLGDRGKAVEAAAQQMKGKTVITTASTDMEQGVAAFARRGGLRFSKDDSSDVRIINLPPDEGLAAFLAGEGDAYIGGIPQRTKAGKEGMVELVSGLDLGPAPINGLVTTRRFATEHQDELLKILRVWFRIVNYVERNPDEGGKTIVSILNKSSASGFTVEDFKRFWQHYERYPLSPEQVATEILSPSGRNYWKNRWDDCNEYFFGIAKVIPAPVRPEDAFWMVQAQEAYLKKYADR